MKRAVIIGAVIALLLFGAQVFGYFVALKSDAYAAADVFLRTDESVTEKIGKVEATHLSPLDAQIRFTANSGDAKFILTVDTPAHARKVIVHLEKGSTAWKVTHWTVISQTRHSAGTKHYNYFRDYDPAIGRYIESDPMGLRAGLNTFGYVAGRPLVRYDAKGLLAGYKNCSDKQRGDIQRGEQQLRDFVNQQCKGCSNTTGKCIDCAFANFMMTKMTNDEVECAQSDSPITFADGTSVNAWGSAPVPGRGMALYPEMFRPKPSYETRCLASTLFHEEMHLMGIGHPNPGKGFDPDDPVYSVELACVRAGLCGRGK